MITFVLIDFMKQSIPGGSDKWGEGRPVKWSLWVLWRPVILKTFPPVRGWRVKPLRCFWHSHSLSVMCSRTKTDGLFQIHYCNSQFHSWRVNSVHSLYVASSLCLSLYHVAFIEYLHLFYFILILSCSYVVFSLFGWVNAITYIWRYISCEQFWCI